MSVSANSRYQPSSTRVLRKVFAVSLLLHGLVYLFFAFVDAIDVYLTYGELNELEFSQATYDLYNYMFVVAARGSLLTLFSTQIVYLVYVYRLNRNASCIKGARPSLSPGWAVGIYFVPIFNFVLPYMNLQELSKIGRCATSLWKKQPNSLLVNLYWMAVVGSRLLVVGGVSLGRSESLEVRLQAACMNVAANFVVIASCYLAWRAFTQIDRQLTTQISNRQVVDQWSCPQCFEQVAVAEKVCPMCGAGCESEVSVGVLPV